MSAKTESFATPRRLSSLRWLPFPAASGLVALGVAGGGQALRWLMLGGITCLLALPLLASLEAGLIALMLFEPNRGFLRRAQYLFVDYTQMDPIHVLTPAVTVLAFAILFRLRGLQTLYQSALAVPFSILSAIYILQIFNPLQGGLAVGLSGVIYMLIPMCWFYFGQTVRPDFLTTTLHLMIALGLICSLHGLYQLMFGFPSFEQYWIDHTEFYESIAVGHTQRALATFSSAEEWGRYVELAAIAAFGFGLQRRPALIRLGYLAAGLALAVILLLTGQRSSIFGLIFGLGVLVLLGSQSFVAAAKRAALMFVCAGLVLAFAKPPSEEEMWNKGADDRVGAVLSHTARGTLNPAQEDSLHARFEMWNYLATKLVPYRPLGLGLAAGSLAAVRFNNLKELVPIDSFFVVVIVACGLPAAFIFAWILGRAAWLAYQLMLRARPETTEAAVARIVAALVPVLILNSIIGLTFSIYSCAPIGWLIVGWIGAETTRNQLAGEGEATQANK